jgi:hypothetical protein
MKPIINIVSLSIGIDENSAFINTLRPLIDEIVFKGLKTRNTLKLVKLNAPPPESEGDDGS